MYGSAPETWSYDTETGNGRRTLKTWYQTLELVTQESRPLMCGANRLVMVCRFLTYGGALRVRDAVPLMTGGQWGRAARWHLFDV